MPNIPNKTPIVTLRSLETSDVDTVLSWHNSDELYRYLGSPRRFVSREGELQWLKARCTSTTDEVNLAICLAEDGRHIGNIYLREIDWISRRGVLHVFIGDPSCRSKGYGTSAIKLILDYAFMDLNLERIMLEVLKDNERATKCYERMGFVQEGVLRRHALKRGHYIDVVLMAILRDEFHSLCDAEND
jgi:UDP-4-amino-4,6-dideoxy-N-acetyl-beta-L-altrosamine N-acetyltransferase